MEKNISNLSERIKIRFNFRNGLNQTISYPYPVLDAAKKWAQAYAETREIEEYQITISNPTGNTMLPAVRVKEPV